PAVDAPAGSSTGSSAVLSGSGSPRAGAGTGGSERDLVFIPGFPCASAKKCSAARLARRTRPGEYCEKSPENLQSGPKELTYRFSDRLRRLRQHLESALLQLGEACGRQYLAYSRGGVPQLIAWAQHQQALAETHQSLAQRILRGSFEYPAGRV